MAPGQEGVMWGELHELLQTMTQQYGGEGVAEPWEVYRDRGKNTNAVGKYEDNSETVGKYKGN